MIGIDIFQNIGGPKPLKNPDKFLAAPSGPRKPPIFAFFTIIGGGSGPRLDDMGGIGKPLEGSCGVKSRQTIYDEKQLRKRCIAREGFKTK